MDNHLLPALLTAGLVYWLYENPRPYVGVGNVATDRDQLMVQQLKRDLGRLVDRYYQKYLYPHAYPVITYVIPSSTSVTHNHEAVHVMTHDPATGEPFPYNTIFQVAVHECAHALCHSKEGGDHGPAFVEILQRLDGIGAEMNLYDPTLPIPKRYQQLCNE